MNYEEEEIRLYDYLNVLRRRKAIFITAFLITFLSTIIFTFTTTPIYDASTTIQIEEEKGPSFSLSEFPITPGFQQFDPLKTEAEIIKSRTIIERVLRKLPQDDELNKAPLQESIEKLQQAIKVEPIRGTNILTISFQDKDPHRAANILDTLSREYIEQNLNLTRLEASQVKKFIKSQLQTVKTDLDNSQIAMERFKSEKGMTILSEDMKNRINRLSEVEMKQVQIEMERKGLEAILSSLKNDKKLALTGINISNPATVEFARKVAELQVQKASMLDYHTEEHPSIMKITAAIDETKARLKEEGEKLLVDLKGRENTLEGIIDRYEEEIEKLPQAEQELTNIMRNLKVSEGIYSFLLEKQKEAEIAEASEVGNIRVIDSAIPPHNPIKPNKKLNSIIGLILGLFLGIGLSFFREYMDNTVKGREEIEKHLGLSIFAAIPFIRMDKNRSIDGQKSPLLALQQNSKSYIWESYRTLRTNIQFSEKRCQTILITSLIIGEGKSTLVTNLATVFARDGAKTLVIDADLRKPMQHKLHNCTQEPGLTNVLTGRANWRETIVRPDIENLSLIPCGPLPPNPSELLGTRKMDEFLAGLKELFDVIIIDTAPLTGLTDTIVLGPKVDGIFIVIEVNRIPVKLAIQGMDSLKMVKANIIGVVLNKIPIERDGYGYGYYDYRYSYHYYHDDGKEKEKTTFLKRWRNWKMKV